MSRTRSLFVAAAGAAALLGVVAPGALAHGIEAGREDLPIPPQAFVIAAATVLALSFAGLALLWPTARLEAVSERRLFAVPRVLEVLCGTIGIALFAVVVWAGLAGTQSSTANIAPTFVFVLFWVGVPVLSLLLGDVFRAFSPWRAIGRLAGWLGQRFAGSSLPEPLPYPERLGRWPAALGILAFAWLELAYSRPDDPSTVAVLALAYAAIQLVGMSLYGVEPWVRRGDAFGVLFSFVGSLAPLDWRDRAVFLRPPFAGAMRILPLAGTVAVVIVAIGTTAFDGFSGGKLWSNLAPDIQGGFEDLGLSAVRALEVTSTIGMLLGVAFVWALYRLGITGMRTVDRSHDIGELSRTFAPSLVPIALAYVFAHYFSLLAFRGQATAYLASDPLGRGWDVFGTATSTIDYSILSSNAIWYVQVGTLVIGHVAGLVLAHDRALTLYGDARKATSSQYWMLAVMIAFTCLGLFLLSEASQG